MKKISLKSLLYAFCIVLFFTDCSEEKHTARHIINGTVTDESGSPITNVTVLLNRELANYSTKTDGAGKYKFEDLELGSYNISFYKDGFEGEAKEIEIIWGRNTEYNCSLKSTTGIPIGGSATVNVIDDLAISDGFYLWLNLSANTQKFYTYCYEIDISNWSDIEIINNVIAEGSEYTKEFNQLYYWDLQPNTNYTYCIVAIDDQDRAGPLAKNIIKTKSANDQPLAEISISNISNGTVQFDVIRNSYCSWYVALAWYITDDLLNKPDIWWASDLYKERTNLSNVYDYDMIDYRWTPEQQGLCALVTLGFSSNNEYGGVISKKIFDSNTGALYSAPLITPIISSEIKVKGISSFNRVYIK
jgi:hypothetical protein